MGNRGSRGQNTGNTNQDNRRETKVLTGHDPSRRYTPSKEHGQQKKVIEVGRRERRHAGGQHAEYAAHPSMISRAAFVAGFALQSFDSFFRDDGNHDEGRNWIGPP